MTMLTTHPPLKVNDPIVVVKGSRSLQISKHVRARVVKIEPLDQERNFNVRLVLRFVNGARGGQEFVCYAKHPHRLADTIVRLWDPIEEKYIEICSHGHV